MTQKLEHLLEGARIDLCNRLLSRFATSLPNASKTDPFLLARMYKESGEKVWSAHGEVMRQQRQALALLLNLTERYWTDIQKIPLPSFAVLEGRISRAQKESLRQWRAAVKEFFFNRFDSLQETVLQNQRMQTDRILREHGISAEWIATLLPVYELEY